MTRLFLLALLLTSIVNGQVYNNQFLSGTLKNDTHYALREIADSTSKFNIQITENKKKPFLAGLMSFALPGAGQIYNESYLTAAIFAAVEIGAIVLAVNYENKGDDQTDFFENYAHQNWSVERYARWTIANIASLNVNLNSDNYNVFDNNGEVDWDELNRLEGDIGGYYSHRLAPFGDQQYYEMIGKYSQFNVGWSEFGDDPNKPYEWNVDPLVDEFKYYSKQRGKANDYYNISKWAVIAVVSNHFISAIEAAWSANRYNKKLNFNISIEEESIGFKRDYYPQLNLSYKF